MFDAASFISPMNRQPTRKRSGNPDKRRVLKSRKSDLIEQIRMTLNLEYTASTLEVLNAGADIQLVAVVDSDIHHPLSQSFDNWGVPRPSSHPTVETSGRRTNGFTGAQAAKVG